MLGSPTLQHVASATSDADDDALLIVHDDDIAVAGDEAVAGDVNVTNLPRALDGACNIKIGQTFTHTHKRAVLSILFVGCLLCLTLFVLSQLVQTRCSTWCCARQRLRRRYFAHALNIDDEKTRCVVVRFCFRWHVHHILYPCVGCNRCRCRWRCALCAATAFSCATSND